MAQQLLSLIHICGLGADVLDGGQGIDTATYYNAATGVTASLDTGLGVINTGEAAGDTYVNIENLTGSNFCLLYTSRCV